MQRSLNLVNKYKPVLRIVNCQQLGGRNFAGPLVKARVLNIPHLQDGDRLIIASTRHRYTSTGIFLAHNLAQPLETLLIKLSKCANRHSAFEQLCVTHPRSDRLNPP